MLVEPLDKAGRVSPEHIGKLALQIRTLRIEGVGVARDADLPSFPDRFAKPLQKACGHGRVEWIRRRGSSVSLGFEKLISKELAHPRVDCDSTGQAFELVCDRLATTVAVREDPAAVLATELRKIRISAQEDARPRTRMVAEYVRRIRLETAEVKEAKRRAVDLVQVAVAADLTCVQVPIRDITAGVEEEEMLE